MVSTSTYYPFIGKVWGNLGEVISWMFTAELKCFHISMILAFEDPQDVHHRNYSRKRSTQAILQAVARDQLLGNLHGQLAINMGSGGIHGQVFIWISIYV